MYFTYITALENFKIKTKLLEPVCLGEDLYLADSFKHVKDKISPGVMNVIGSLEFDWIFNGGAFVFKRGYAMTQEAGKTEVINFLRDVNAYIHILWLYSDNSVNTGLGFAVGEKVDVVHSNSLNLRYTKADGLVSDFELSPDEIKETVGLVGTAFKGVREQQLPKFTALQKATSRFNAANFHLQAARSNYDLGLKIAQMCTYFECLFSTSTAELAHQLSERIAFFVEKDPVERLNTYKEMKKAYGIRSKIVHGDRISKNISDLVQVSLFCDQVARKVNEIILSDESLVDLMYSHDSCALDSYMLNLIFGLAEQKNQS